MTSLRIPLRTKDCVHFSVEVLTVDEGVVALGPLMDESKFLDNSL